jgi:hypothetical protein
MVKERFIYLTAESAENAEDKKPKIKKDLDFLKLLNCHPRS